MILAATPAHSHGRALSTWRAVQNGAYIAPVVVTGQLTAAIGLPAVLAGPCVLAAMAALAYLAASPAGAPRRMAAAALRRRLAPEP